MSQCAVFSMLRTGITLFLCGQTAFSPTVLIDYRLLGKGLVQNQYTKAMKQMPVVMMRYTEVGFLLLKQTLIENKRLWAKLSKKSSRLHKTNPSVFSTLLTGTCLLHFQCARGLKFKASIRFVMKVD